MGMYFRGISHVPWGYFPWEYSWEILPMVSIFYRETHGEFPWGITTAVPCDAAPWCPISTGKPMVNSYVVSPRMSHGDVVPWCPISTGKPMVNYHGVSPRMSHMMQPHGVKFLPGNPWWIPLGHYPGCPMWYSPMVSNFYRETHGAWPWMFRSESHAIRFLPVNARWITPDIPWWCGNFEVISHVTRATKLYHIGTVNTHEKYHLSAQFLLRNPW